MGCGDLVIVTGHVRGLLGLGGMLGADPWDLDAWSTSTGCNLMARVVDYIRQSRAWRRDINQFEGIQYKPSFSRYRFCTRYTDFLPLCDEYIDPSRRTDLHDVQLILAPRIPGICVGVCV